MIRPEYVCEIPEVAEAIQECQGVVGPLRRLAPLLVKHGAYHDARTVMRSVESVDSLLRKYQNLIANKGTYG